LIEQVREPNAVGFGGDAKCITVTVEAEGSATLYQSEPR
jgi:hypothetical protein